MPLSPQPKTMEWSHQSTNSRSRSNPIVICESLSKLQIRKQDDDDDDEDDQQQQQRQALSTSLPPGAPQLGSMKGSKGR